MDIFYELEIDPSHVIGILFILNAFIFVFFYAQFTSFKLFSFWAWCQFVIYIRETFFLLTVGLSLLAYRWTITDCLPLDYHCLLTVGLSLIAYRWTIIACLTVGLSLLAYRWTIIACLPLDYHCLPYLGLSLLSYRWTITDCSPLDYHCWPYPGLSLLADRWTIIAWSTVGLSLLVFTVGLSLLVLRFISLLNLLDGVIFYFVDLWFFC